ncbi:hypothetical protein E2C01_040357 [Portunus trituberculatus]|uniref:Uncharacterized protein n=1 Tax=Portunus trituberculatus TaxID=210409 RepID=A0A5B7FNJ6_PORTR|nr:hypothetical protein [Portunus trituberculatus]
MCLTPLTMTILGRVRGHDTRPRYIWLGGRVANTVLHNPQCERSIPKPPNLHSPHELGNGAQQALP